MTIKENNIKTLKISINNGWYLPNVVEIDFKTHLISYSPGKDKIKLSKEKKEAFLDELEEISITNWEKEYHPKDIIVLDGTSWSLQITFDDNTEFNSRGDNAYPRKWKAFCESLKICPDKLCSKKVTSFPRILKSQIDC